MASTIRLKIWLFVYLKIILFESNAFLIKIFFRYQQLLSIVRLKQIQIV